LYLLDTNVISELRRQRPHGGVVAWLQSVDDRDLRLAAITLAEIQARIEITREQNEARAAELETWLDQVAATYNVLDMDGRTFRLWARLMHGRGEHLLEDAMIAATARVHGLVVVTRNTRDFTPFGVKTLNPFKTG
jgi:predicted nucleic acid-binding protein